MKKKLNDAELQLSLINALVKGAYKHLETQPDRSMFVKYTIVTDKDKSGHVLFYSPEGVIYAPIGDPAYVTTPLVLRAKIEVYSDVQIGHELLNVQGVGHAAAVEHVALSKNAATLLVRDKQRGFVALPEGTQTAIALGVLADKARALFNFVEHELQAGRSVGRIDERCAMWNGQLTPYGRWLEKQKRER